MTACIRRSLSLILICLLGGAVMFSLFGCMGQKKYKVDYDGRKSFYENAKNAYAAGDEVKLYYGMIATDTDYSFLLDGEPLNTQYDNDKGFVIRFTMPAHDVKLECRTVNSMIYVPPTEPEEVMLIDSYRATVATVGGDHYKELVLYSYDEDHALLKAYSGSDGTDETESKYLVPRDTVDKCREVIDRYKLREWRDRDDLAGMTGVLLVCRFRDGDDYVRVSSESMPEDGEAAFSEIEAILQSCALDEYKLED